jgi:hypothetical protein
MFKVVGLIVALVLFGALPAVAAAQTPPGEGDTVSSGNTQDADIEQDAEAGGEGGNGHGRHGADGGGNAGNQAAICQQNAGADALCDINQSQRFGAGGFVDVDRDGVDDRREHRGVGGVGGGVVLARTGFDAWILALIGGIAVLGGIAMLAARRRVSS